MLNEKQIRVDLEWEDPDDLDSPNKLDAKEIAFMEQQIKADNKIDDLENLTAIALLRLIRIQKLEKIIKTILWPIRRFCRLFSSRPRMVV